MLLEGDQQIILLLCTSSYKMPSEFEKIYTQSYNHIPNKDASCDISNRVFFLSPFIFWFYVAVILHQVVIVSAFTYKWRLFFKIWKGCFIYVQIVKTWQGNMLFDMVLGVFFNKKKTPLNVSLMRSTKNLFNLTFNLYKCNYKRLNSLQNCNKVFTFYRKVF